MDDFEHVDDNFGELNPKIIAGLIYDWVAESDYNFEVKIKEPNRMEKMQEKYNDAIDTEIEKYNLEDIDKILSEDGLFMVRKTTPHDECIIYFIGNEKYNRFAILEEVGVYLDNILLNSVHYGDTLSVSDAGDDVDGLMDLF